MARILLAFLAAFLIATGTARAQDIGPMQTVLQEQRALIEDASRRTIGPAIEAIGASGLPSVPMVLTRWQAREMWQRDEDGLFFFAEDAGEDANGEDQLRLFSVEDGSEVAVVLEDGMTQLKPNGGVRGVIGSALVRFQLSDPNPEVRTAALDSIGRDPEEDHLEALLGSIEGEPDAAIAARKERIARLLTIEFGAPEEARIEAIRSFAGDLGVDVRGTLNPLVATSAGQNLAHQMV